MGRYSGRDVGGSKAADNVDVALRGAAESDGREETREPAPAIENWPVVYLQPHPRARPASNTCADALASLVATMHGGGALDPIVILDSKVVVAGFGRHGGVVVDGLDRLEAAKRAGRKIVPCLVVGEATAERILGGESLQFVQDGVVPAGDADGPVGPLPSGMPADRTVGAPGGQSGRDPRKRADAAPARPPSRVAPSPSACPAVPPASPRTGSAPTHHRPRTGRAPSESDSGRLETRRIAECAQYAGGKWSEPSSAATARRTRSAPPVSVMRLPVLDPSDDVDDREQQPTRTDGLATTGPAPDASAPADPASLPPGSRLEQIDIERVDLHAVRHTPEQIERLSGSILEVGLLHPPTLRPHGDRYEIVAGAGRMAALRRLGHVRVLALVVPGDPKLDDRTILARLDENLARAELPPAERDRLLVQRKETYERLHPDSATSEAKRRAGRASAASRKGTRAAAARVESSTTTTAKVTGRSVRSVQAAEARRKRAASEVRAAYERGDITAAQVDELVKLDTEQQVQMLGQVKGKSRSETRRLVQKARGAIAGKRPAGGRNVPAGINESLQPPGDHAGLRTRLRHHAAVLDLHLDQARAMLKHGKTALGPQREAAACFFALRRVAAKANKFVDDFDPRREAPTAPPAAASDLERTEP